MNTKFNLSFVAILIFLVSCNVNCQYNIKNGVLEFDGEYLEQYQDVTPIVVKVIEAYKELNVKKVVFPKGKYHFYPTYAPEFYCEITNNDNGLKRTPFPLMNLNGFEIDGGGSEFIFHSKIVPFILENSSNIKIANLSVNWDVPFVLEGKVIANNEKDKTFDIKVSTPYVVKYGRLYLSLEREDTPYHNKYGPKFNISERYDVEVGQNIVWDPKTKSPYYNTLLYQMQEKGIEAVELEKGVIRLKGESRQVPPVGSIFVSKGEYLANRMCPAFRVFKSKELLFENINVHHAGAMGFIAERSENITLDGFNVVLKEGQGRMVTTSADATHFCNNKGHIIIRNSIFENMLDDATNIHGTYVRVNQIIDDYSVAVETYHPHQNGYLFGETGDEVRIVNNKTLEPTVENLFLTKVKRINEKISILTFDKPVKNKVGLYYGIENVTWSPTAVLEDNIVRNNRARSFLLASSKGIVVKGNHFSSQMASLRITADMDLWNESGPSNNLVIENNIFEDCGYGGYNRQSTILIDPIYSDKKGAESKFNKNIIIRNNLFKTFDTPILTAISIDGLVFHDNVVEQTDTYVPILENLPSLYIENCSDVSVKGNSFKYLNGSKPVLKYDSKTTDIKIGKRKKYNVVYP
ncbi:alpha-1,3-galactosidase-related protein [Maribacter thermophilus]|uniref:alpha-1,3-galactosidase-related protein n=1 Tax=Maribacter thermophilus TaxID=1197874 RepID=UPI0006417645|nr:hypothetical protein [Maribacter thermophilus]